MSESNSSNQAFQIKEIRQLVVLIRYKPQPVGGGFDTGAAAGMLSGVTGKLDAIAGAVEGAMASIPGLDLFVKEEKNNPFPADKDYTYFDDYSAWDQELDTIKGRIQELNEHSRSEKFEFSSTDIKDIASNGEKLFSKLDELLSEWKKYTAWVHLIGIGPCSGILGACSKKMAESAKFTTEKWTLKSVLFYGCGAAGAEWTINKKALKGEGTVLSLANPADLTAGVLHYFGKNQKLIDLIKDGNKNTLSLATGKVKMRLIQIMAILLSGLNISAGDTSELDKFKQIKDDVVGMVEDLIGFIKSLIDEGTSYISLPDLPDFSQLSQGLDQIPTQVKNQFDDFLNKEDKEHPEEDGLLVKLKKGAQSTNLSVGPSDLAGVLNCLCPLFDHIQKSLAIFSIKDKHTEHLATQILEKAGIENVLSPAGIGTQAIHTDPDYLKAMQQAAINGQPDTATLLVQRAQDLLRTATKKTNQVQQMQVEEKRALAEAIGLMTLPMLPSKIRFYKKLLDIIPFNLNELTKDYTMSQLGGMASEQTSKIGIQFPAKLTASMAAADAEVKRIKTYFDKNAFALAEHRDTMYLIYNVHNLTLKKPHGELLKCIDQQTGYMSWMQNKGYDYTGDYKYVQSGQTPVQEKAMPATEIEPTPA